MGKLIGGRGLAAKDQEVYGASSDPYAILWVGSEGEMEASPTAVRSETVFDSLDPVWNMQFQFDGGEGGFGDGQFLHVRLFDFDANSAHDYMGKYIGNFWKQVGKYLHDRGCCCPSFLSSYQ